LAGIVDIDSNQDIIFGNDVTVEDIVWMGKQPTLKEKSEQVGLKHTAESGKLREWLNEAKRSGRTVHYLPPYRPEHVLKIFELLDVPPSKASDSASVDLIQAVVEQRNIKTDEEIRELEKAVDVSVDMHVEARKKARPGMLEAEIVGAVQDIALSSGGQISFPVIGTVHGETLHNHYHGNILKSGDMFLLDAGAETVMGYGGDLSSTFPVDLTFTERQKEIYTITLRAHDKAIEALRPGINFRDIHFLACRTLAAGLKEMGFMKGDVDEAVEEGAHALFFPCGTGHMMGMDVHDMENLGEKYVGYGGREKSTKFGIKSLRLARELEPGFVLTIEPGIYFIPELIDSWRLQGKFTRFIDYDKVETYKDFGGIRNEEDLLITDDGYRVLGKPKPKTIQDVEALSRSGHRSARQELPCS
jgi:Xaa-Pro aminopeptidase